VLARPRRARIIRIARRSVNGTSLSARSHAQWREPSSPRRSACCGRSSGKPRGRTRASRCHTVNRASSRRPRVHPRGRRRAPARWSTRRSAFSAQSGRSPTRHLAGRHLQQGVHSKNPPWRTGRSSPMARGGHRAEPARRPRPNECLPCPVRLPSGGPPRRAGSLRLRPVLEAPGLRAHRRGLQGVRAYQQFRDPVFDCAHEEEITGLLGFDAANRDWRPDDRCPRRQDAALFDCLAPSFRSRTTCPSALYNSSSLLATTLVGRQIHAQVHRPDNS